MNAKEREEIAKWLRLGYETYGPDGASAVADAIGVALRGVPESKYGVVENTTPVKDPESTATSGGGTFPPNEWSSPDFKFRYGSTPKTKRTPRNCPPAPPRGDPNWRSYVGKPEVFHCGFDGFLENRQPTPDWPISECFYDEAGQLVDEAHPHSGCRGTPNQFGAEDWLEHTILDDGGPLRSGLPALWESLWYSPDDRRRWEDQFKRGRRPR